jgi:hypothetical protein
MNGSDITGYLFRGETFCPTCIHDLFVPFDWAGGSQHSTEEILDRVATEQGVNRHNEKSFGSRQFPQALYLDDVTRADLCFFCGTPLIDSTT